MPGLGTGEESEFPVKGRQVDCGQLSLGSSLPPGATAGPVEKLASRLPGLGEM